MKRALLPLLTLATLGLSLGATGLPQPQTIQLTFKGGTQAHGTLQMPLGPGRVPVALILPGFGDFDRDGRTPGQPASKGHYALLADELAEQGIASLRFDKRGTGETVGERVPAFDTYVNDAAAWLDRLHADNRLSKVVVVGHGEGALVGTLAAQASGADALLIVDGLGRNILDTVLESPSTGTIKEQREAEKALIRAMKKGDTANIPAELASAYTPERLQFIRSWAKYDPAKELKQYKGAVLLIQGGANSAVGAKDWSALVGAKTGATQVTVPKMGVDLRAVEAMAAPAEGPLAPTLVTMLATFIKNLR